MDKLKSRKLWAFVITFIVVCFLAIGNAVFGWGLPNSDLLYLVIVAASYILGQGYVDAKQQPVQTLPAEDVTNSITNILKAEVEKLGNGNNIPMESIIEAVLQQELSNLSVAVNVTPTAQIATTTTAPEATT